MAFIHYESDHDGRPRGGQLWLGMLELALGYIVIATALMVNRVPDCWITAAIASLAFLGAGFLVERLELLSGNRWSIFMPDGVDVSLEAGASAELIAVNDVDSTQGE